MKNLLQTLLLALLLPATGFFAQAQSQKEPPTAEESAAMESERLEKALKLEDWQVFYVDSTLRHDFVGMEAEIKEMQTAKVGNYGLYLRIQDKWFIQIEESFKKFFTEAQWKKFIKSGMSSAHRESFKRREKEAKKAAKNK